MNLTKKELSNLKSIPGFPIGNDEDIIALSDPPHYTACPNPFITEFIKQHGTIYDAKSDKYDVKPFATDVSEGKNDPIYNAHSYHTKVPPKAIVRYLLHYTKPGDVIYDGFCGTGMTGVASQICQNPEPEFKKIIEKEMTHITWGSRHAILCDISPIATFIAYNLNKDMDKKSFEAEANQILEQVEQECGWMYQTQHTVDGQIQYDTDGTKKPILGKINYTVWSDVFVCPNCTEELVFWDIAVKDNEVQDIFSCTSCKTKLTKRELQRSRITKFDDTQNKNIKQTKQVPVLINYTVTKGRKSTRYVKKPDKFDLDLIKQIENTKIQDWYPSNPMMNKGERWGDTWRAGVHSGVTNVHHFYTRRNLIINTNFFKKFRNKENIYKFWFSASQSRLTNLNRYMKQHNRHVGPLSGTLYLSSTPVEISPFYFFSDKIFDLPEIKKTYKKIISTQSSTKIPQIPNNSIDYIFTDPPFGANLMYSELNFIQESWLKVMTNNKDEAIMNDSQKKGLAEYQKLMIDCFTENHRILKPGRWMTVIFHNSQNSVWIAIQEALEKAGFVIADVRILDKKKGTTKQLSYQSGTVKQDLIISAYKPFGGLEQYFESLQSSTEEGAWKFIDEHLKHLPILVELKGIVEIVAERQKFLLFDRMVAFHIQKGLRVPMSAAEFYEKLHQKYPERDNMYFLPEQIIHYDQIKKTTKSIQQTTLFVEDEKSSILWLNEILKTPQTYQQIQPKFLREIHQSKFEKLPELTEILQQNFLQDEKGKWYIPDPTQQKDLEKIRIRSLLREFEIYKNTKSKLKSFRTEAIRAGFEDSWSKEKYDVIVEIGNKIPENILQEDITLLMYFDNASSRLG